MAGCWMETFESHINSSQMARKYASFAGAFVSQSGRIFGTAGGISSTVAVTPSFGLDDTFILGFGILVTSNLATLDDSGNGLYCERGATEQFHLRFTTNATKLKVSLYRSTTLIAETGFDYDLNAWQYFELEVTVHPSAGTYELRRGGVTQISGTGVNTAFSGSADWDIFAFRFTGNFSSTCMFDDLYVCNGSGSVHNTFLGPQVGFACNVTANGSVNQWDNDTPGSSANNFDQVNEGAADNPDETGVNGTVSTDVVGEEELYTISDVPAQITGAISFVMLGAQLGLDVAGSRTAAFRMRNGGTTVSGRTVTVNQTVFDEFQQIFDVNPVDSAAFDIADINGSEIGARLES